MKREIILPFNASKLDSVGISSGADKPVCGMCKRSFARYTCPRCNLPYCSLVCYRAESHTQCTEPFYKREVENQIKSAPSTSSDDKRRMMDILKRFEDQAAEEAEESGEDVEDDLARRLEGIDLETADADIVLSLLSESQRSAFLSAVQDPTGERAQQILAEGDVILPWWDTPSSPISGRKYGKEPEMVVVPQSLLDKQPSTGTRSFLHNVLALSIAYAWTTRTLACSPLNTAGKQDLEIAREMISRVTPFLVDRTSTIIFGSVDGAWTDVVSRMEETTPSLLRALLQDAETLLQPSLVSEASTSNPLGGSPSRRVLLALSDLSALFPKDVKHKLMFYAAQVVSSTLPEWERILAVVRKKNQELGESEESLVGKGIQRITRKEYPLVEEI